MTLKSICMEIAEIEADLMYGRIPFSYPRLAAAMKAGHPAEILDDILSPVGWPALAGKEVPDEVILEMLEGLKSFAEDFEVPKLNVPITHLMEYLGKEGEIYTPSRLDRFIGEILDVCEFDTGESYGESCDDGELFWTETIEVYFDEDIDIQEEDYENEDGELDEEAYYEAIHDETGWTMEEIEIGYREEYIKYTISYEMDEDGRVLSFGKLEKMRLVGDDATHVNYEKLEVTDDDYEDLIEKIEEIGVEE